MENTRIFGYIRVSSKEQNLDRQRDSLKQYVPHDRDIYADTQSGKDFNRPAYQALKKAVRSGDTIYIHEMERLGRNRKEIKENLEEFKNMGVTVRILNLPTTMVDYSQYGDKMQKILMEMVNNILIEVLATMAETERDNIRKRQKEGIESAHKRGTKFGRPRLVRPKTWLEDYFLWVDKKITSAAYMKKYNMPSSTFYKKIAETRDELGNDAVEKRDITHDKENEN